jgi:tetratricopeptide (TPR) repeat protein
MRPGALAVVGLLLASQGQQLVVPDLGPATREPALLTPEETQALRNGIALYDKGQLDAAYTAFKQLLDRNPGNIAALYELALVHHARREFQQAIDLAAKGTTYKGASLPQLYGLIGNTLDDAGDPKRALDVYTRGLKVVPGSGALYFNMAMTHAKSLNDPATAMTILKQGAVADPNHAGTHLALSQLFLAEDLRTPALFALSRFLMLEPGSARTPEAYKAWYAILNTSVSSSGIKVNPNKSKDEGDLTKLDLHISLSKIAAMGAAQGRTQIQILATQVEMLLEVYAKEKPAGADAKTFLWAYYMPFMREMAQKKLAEPFVYYVSQRVNMPGIADWVTANRPRIQEMLVWAKNYAWPPKWPVQ